MTLPWFSTILIIPFFDMTEKQNGKPLFKVSFTVSADGKTLTETGGAVGVSEKFKAVYDRQ